MPIPMSATRSALESFIHAMPKVELHIHLEGSVSAATLRELARAKGHLDPDVAQWISAREAGGYRYATFMEFIEAFKFVALMLKTPADYALATTRLMEQFARENVRYAEVTLSAGVILWKGQPLEAVVEAVLEAAQSAERRLGVQVNWIFDAVRQFGPEPARQVAEWAGRYRDQGVVAFGIGGDEVRGPVELFAAVFRRARELGLRAVAHAGETAGPDSVRRAVEMLGAERIGHGLAAAQDSTVLALLRDRAIPLEVCLTSNVATGRLKRIEDHPLRRLMTEGLTVSLNSDDPGLFATSLEEEFRRARVAFSLSPGELILLSQNAARSAFLPRDARERLCAEITQTCQSPNRSGRLDAAPLAGLDHSNS
jgi:adenosine deaminase